MTAVNIFLSWVNQHNRNFIVMYIIFTFLRLMITSIMIGFYFGWSTVDYAKKSLVLLDQRD